MASLKTVYRAGVMIATTVIVVKGWQLYGPSAEQTKKFALSAWEKAQAAWTDAKPNTSDPAAPATDPRTLAPQLATTPLAVPPAAPALSPAPNSPFPNLGGGDAAGPAGITTPTSPAASTPAQNLAQVDNVAPLLTHLQEIGGGEAQIVPWGSGGNLFRCCCRAKLTDTSPLATHFEAVANEPKLAVEQVVAQVEAWRTEQQQLLR